jgi:hypothetical protein
MLISATRHSRSQLDNLGEVLINGGGAAPGRCGTLTRDRILFMRPLDAAPCVALVTALS